MILDYFRDVPADIQQKLLKQTYENEKTRQTSSLFVSVEEKQTFEQYQQNFGKIKALLTSLKTGEPITNSILYPMEDHFILGIKMLNKLYPQMIRTGGSMDLLMYTISQLDQILKMFDIKGYPQPPKFLLDFYKAVHNLGAVRQQSLDLTQNEVEQKKREAQMRAEEEYRQRPEVREEQRRYDQRLQNYNRTYDVDRRQKEYRINVNEQVNEKEQKRLLIESARRKQNYTRALEMDQRQKEYHRQMNDVEIVREQERMLEESKKRDSEIQRRKNYEERILANSGTNINPRLSRSSATTMTNLPITDTLELMNVRNQEPDEQMSKFDQDRYLNILSGDAEDRMEKEGDDAEAELETKRAVNNRGNLPEVVNFGTDNHVVLVQKSDEEAIIRQTIRMLSDADANTKAYASQVLNLRQSIPINLQAKYAPNIDVLLRRAENLKSNVSESEKQRLISRVVELSKLSKLGLHLRTDTEMKGLNKFLTEHADLNESDKETLNLALTERLANRSKKEIEEQLSKKFDDVEIIKRPTKKKFGRQAIQKQQSQSQSKRKK